MHRGLPRTRDAGESGRKSQNRRNDGRAGSKRIYIRVPFCPSYSIFLSSSCPSPSASISTLVIVNNCCCCYCFNNLPPTRSSDSIFVYLYFLLLSFILFLWVNPTYAIFFFWKILMLLNRQFTGEQLLPHPFENTLFLLENSSSNTVFGDHR